MRTVGNGDKDITPGRISRDGRLRIPLVIGKKRLPTVEKSVMGCYSYRW